MWALVSLDGMAPSWMVYVSASVNLPLHQKVQKFSSGTVSPRWSQRKGRKMLVVVVWYYIVCVCAFVVLALVFSVLCQVINWEERLGNGRLLCQVWCGTLTQSTNPSSGHCLGFPSVLWHCWFQEGHLTCKKCSLQNRLRKTTTNGEPANPGLVGK